MVNTNDSDTDWVPTSAAELDDLVPKVVNHAIDLLDHGLREYLYFDANLKRGNWPSSNLVASIEDCCFPWNNLAKCPIAAASVNASTAILHIRYTILANDGPVDEPGGSLYGDQILIEVHCHEIALIGRPMFVDLTFEKAPELSE